MPQGFGSSHQSPLLPSSPGHGLNGPPIPLSTGFSCSQRALTTGCHCMAALCSAVPASGCKLAPQGEAECTWECRLAEPWQGGEEGM